MKNLQLQRKFFNNMGSKNPKEYYFTEEFGRVGLSNGHALWLIPEDGIYINIDKLKKIGEYDFFGKQLKEVEDELKLLQPDVIQGEPNSKNEMLKLIGEDIEVYLNTKLLQFFEDPTYYGTAHNKPVFIKENDEFVGMVFPIVLK